MNPYKKYYSRYYLGLCKQLTRYNKKPEVMEKPILPVILSYNEENGEVEPLKQKFCKKRVFNTTLKNLVNISCNHSPNIGGMYSKFTKNKDGKYILSREGKERLKRKKEKILKLKNLKS
jgi:hypothetical protein